MRSWPKHPETVEHYSVDAGLTNDGSLAEDYQHETDHAAEHQANHHSVRQHTDNIPLIPNNGTHKHMDNDDIHTQQYHTDTLKAPINENAFLNLWSEASKKRIYIENDFNDSPAAKPPYSSDHSIHNVHNDGEPELNSLETHHTSTAHRGHHDQLTHVEVENVAHPPEHYKSYKHEDHEKKRMTAGNLWNGEWQDDDDHDDDHDDADEDVVIPVDGERHHQQNVKDYFEDYDHAGDHLPGELSKKKVIQMRSFLLLTHEQTILKTSRLEVGRHRNVYTLDKKI